MTNDLCATCGKNFKSVKHAGHRTDSHEFVPQTETEKDVLWRNVALEDGREGQVTGVEWGQFAPVLTIKVRRSGTVRRSLTEISFTS